MDVQERWTSNIIKHLDLLEENILYIDTGWWIGSLHLGQYRKISNICKIMFDILRLLTNKNNRIHEYIYWVCGRKMLNIWKKSMDVWFLYSPLYKMWFKRTWGPLPRWSTIWRAAGGQWWLQQLVSEEYQSGLPLPAGIGDSGPEKGQSGPPRWLA